MTAPTDTLTANAALLEQLRKSGDYNYDREVTQAGESLWETILREFERFFHNSADGVESSLSADSPLLWIMVIVFVCLLVWLLFHARFKIFSREKEDDELDYDVTLDSIYGIDFDEMIAQAVDAGDHYSTVRLAYLHALRRLSDAGLVEWRPFKTPSQYRREYRREPMGELTKTFVRVRYGGYKATEAIARRTMAMRDEILSNINEARHARKGNVK